VYQWFVFTHLIGLVLFVFAHGVSAFVSWQIRPMRDPAAVAGHLTMSQQATRAAYVGLILLLIGGAAAATDAGLVVNCTTQGMVGQAALELDLTPLPCAATVMDLIYTPLETPLLVAAKARGHAVLNGLDMLLWQAKPGFAAWFGVDPEVTDALRQAVLRG